MVIKGTTKIKVRKSFCFSLFLIKVLGKFLALCLMTSYMVLFFAVLFLSVFGSKKILWEWGFWFGLGLNWGIWLLNPYSYKEPFLARKDGYKKVLWEWKFWSSFETRLKCAGLIHNSLLWKFGAHAFCTHCLFSIV